MLSIIVPVLNEAGNVGPLVRYLFAHSVPVPVQVMVVDAGSTDDTCEEAVRAGAQVMHSPARGRAAQMNHGATHAIHPVLYFVHADSRPPAAFITNIKAAVNKGYMLGRYRTKFSSTSILLKINAWFTRFDWEVCYGGDQTLFITKALFNAVGGFKADMLIMEEYDLVQRARMHGPYKIFSEACLVSARKYETNSWLTIQLANRRIVQMWKRGATQQEMVNEYKRMLVYR